MKAIKVQYMVRAEFVEENMANIRNIMDALRRNPIRGLKYSAFTLKDNQTFVHINIFKDDETLEKFTSLGEFKEFLSALKNSKPASPPKPENMNFVGAGFEI